MGEVRGGTTQVGRKCLACAGFDFRVGKLATEGAPHRLDRFTRRGLIHGNPERAVTHTQIDPFGAGARDDLVQLRTGV